MCLWVSVQTEELVKNGYDEDVGPFGEWGLRNW